MSQLENSAASREQASRELPIEMGSIVRQPILDPGGQVHAYELLFRIAPKDDEGAADYQDALTILDNIVVFGLDRLTGGLPAFFNCPAEALTEDLIASLSPSMIVLEITASLEMSPKLIEICRKLKMAGFRFALVDFTESPAPHPLLDLVDYVKVDSKSLEPNGFAPMRQLLKNTSAAAVALEVDSQESYRKARAEGFKYFQGFYFCKSEPLQNAKISANRLVHIEILRELFKDPLELSKLCPLVLRDASLVYRVLRLVNSPAYAIRGSIDSIESAILILGDIAFRRIATLAIQCALSAGGPREILHMALVRARFCAKSASLCNLDENEQYLLGMLSLLPAMLSIPMETIVPELPLRDQIRQALLGHATRERCLLEWIESHECRKDSACQAIEDRYGLGRSRLMQCYVDALVRDPVEDDLMLV
jgi:EAL and modified HD-GYP domain-containing signal transduction protein